MLMDHRSGLMGSYYCDSMLLNDRSRLPHERFLQNISGERLKASPDEFGAYCNDGFHLLEILVERVSGESFTDYVEDHICKPLGMEQTGTPWNAFDTAKQTRVFLNRKEYTPEYCLTIGEGTLPVHIRHLREKIEKNPNEPRIIRTVWGVGYIIGSSEE